MGLRRAAARVVGGNAPRRCGPRGKGTHGGSISGSSITPRFRGRVTVAQFEG